MCVCMYFFLACNKSTGGLMHSKSHFMFAKLIFDMLRNEKKQKKERWNGKLEPSSFAFRCLPVLPQHSIA